MAAPHHKFILHGRAKVKEVAERLFSAAVKPKTPPPTAVGDGGIILTGEAEHDARLAHEDGDLSADSDYEHSEGLLPVWLKTAKRDPAQWTLAATCHTEDIPQWFDLQVSFIHSMLNFCNQ